MPEYFAPKREWNQMPTKEDHRPNASMYEMSAERHVELDGSGNGSGNGRY